MRNKELDTIQKINERRMLRVEVLKTAYINYHTSPDEASNTFKFIKTDPSDFEFILAVNYCVEKAFITAESTEDPESITFTIQITSNGIDFYEDYVLENDPASHGL